MFSIAKRIFKQIIHDKRSLAMIILAPILLTTLIYLLLGETDYKPTVRFGENVPMSMANELKNNKDISITTATNPDATISYGENGLVLKMKEYDTVKTSKITEAVKSSLTKLLPANANLITEFEYGSKESSMFDNLAYLLLGVLSFMFVFILSGISFVRERTANTLERLMRTPVKNIEIVVGYSLGFSIFAVSQSVILTLFAKLVLKTPIKGSLFLAILIMVLISIIAVMLGILVSVVSRTEFQVVQFIPILVVPQIFFSGLIPVDTLPYHLDYLSKIMPLYYGGNALKGIMIYGDCFSDIAKDFMILVGIIVVLFFANTFAVSKYRND